MVIMLEGALALSAMSRLNALNASTTRIAEYTLLSTSTFASSAVGPTVMVVSTSAFQACTDNTPPIHSVPGRWNGAAEHSDAANHVPAGTSGKKGDVQANDEGIVNAVRHHRRDQASAQLTRNAEREPESRQDGREHDALRVDRRKERT